MAGNMINNPRPQFLDGSGAPYALGTLSFFDADAHATPLDTHSDKELTVDNPNPIILDAAGRPANGGTEIAIFLKQQSYYVVLKDSAGTEIWDADDVSNILQVDVTGVPEVDTYAALTVLTKASLADGVIYQVQGRTVRGDMGPVDFEWVAGDTTTVNTGTVLAADEGGTGRWLMRFSGVVHDKWFNVTGDNVADDTTELLAFNSFVAANNLEGEYRAVTYLITGSILSHAAISSCRLWCPSGIAIFNVTTNAMESVISFDEGLDIHLENLEAQCNDLVSVPFDVRNTTNANGGSVVIENCTAIDVKETTQTKNPDGIQVAGEYDYVKVNGCTVTNVSRTTLAKSCTGIGVSDNPGVIEVTNNTISGISTPNDVDADAIKIFSTGAANTADLPGRALVENNIIRDFEGRGVKSQHAHTTVQNNIFEISDSFVTITNWKVADFQLSNGVFNDNTINIGSGVTFASGTIITFANNRDFRDKVSNCRGNKVITGTTIPFFAQVAFDNLDSAVFIESNECGLVATFCQATFTPADVDLVRLFIRGNSINSTARLFQVSSNVNYGSKFHLEITDNRNLGAVRDTVRQDTPGDFGVEDHFVIRDNESFTDKVEWVFNTNVLKNGNSFLTGAQSNTNKGTGMTTAYHVITTGFHQWNVNATTAVQRVSVDGVTWTAWF